MRPLSFPQEKERLEEKRYTKVILDPSLKTVPDANIFKNPDCRVILAASKKTAGEKKPQFPANAEIIFFDLNNGRFKIKDVLDALFKMNAGKILVEAGTGTLTSFWEENIFDKIHVYVGSKIAGGRADFPPLSGERIKPLNEESELEIETVRVIDGDMLLVVKRT